MPVRPLTGYVITNFKKKLEERAIPGYILRILVFWYEHQNMAVRWGCNVSQTFKVSNGVRQGGILSPHFFNVYVNDLLLV